MHLATDPARTLGYEPDDIYLIQGDMTPSVPHGDGWSKYRLGVLH